MLEDRYAGIEHQNRLLLSRMSGIMMRAEGDGAKAGAGGIDNVSTAWQYGRSLNTRNRKKEMGRILEDNKRIHARIASVAPFYDHFKWEEEAAKAEKIALQLTEFQQLPIGAEKRSARSPRAGSPAKSPRAAGAAGDSAGAAAAAAAAPLASITHFGGGGAAPAGGSIYPPPPTFGAPPGTSGSFTLPSLGLASRGATPGGYGAGLATPGGSILGSLNPSSLALLAQYGYGAIPAGGAGVPAAAGASFAGAGGYPSLAATPAGAAPPLDLSSYMAKLSLAQKATG